MPFHKYFERLEFLAQTPTDRQILAALLEKVSSVEVGRDSWRLELGHSTLQFGPPGDPSKYADWPASFRTFVERLGVLRLNEDELVVGEGADGGVDCLESLLEGTELQGREHEVRCPVEQIPNWWIFHPDERNAEGEPQLRHLAHGGGNFGGESFERLGSLALQLIARRVGVDATPRDTDEKPVAVKILGKLHRSVNKAEVRDRCLFSAERPMKRELWVHYPDACSRLAVYDLSNPRNPGLLGRVQLPAVPADFALVGDRALVLCVDWKESMFRLLEVDLSNPMDPRLLGEIHTLTIPEHRSFAECESRSRIVLSEKERLLVRFYLNLRDAPELFVFDRVDDAWALASTHAVGADKEHPFAEVRDGETTVADAAALCRLFDAEWGSFVIHRGRAVLSKGDPPHRFQVLERDGQRGPELRFSDDGLSVRITTWEDFVVVASSMGIAFLRVFDDGTLVLNETIEHDSPREVAFSGGLMVVNNRFDKDAPVGKGYSLELCSIKRS